MILITGKEGLLHTVGKDIQNVFQNVFKQRGKWRREVERYVADYYRSDMPHATRRTPVVVAMVDGRMKHGGLGDRLRGIVSVYSVCKEMGVEFKVLFNHPFMLSDYLCPNEVDWTIDAEEMTYNSADALPVFCGTNGTHVEMPFQKLWLKQNIGRRLPQTHVYTNAHLLQDERFARCFGELFRMTEPLQKAVDSVKREIGGSYIAVTCRFQQLLGDFREGDFEVLPEAERHSLMHDTAEQVAKVYRDNGGRLPVLLTSDSVSFLEYAASRMPFVHTVPGQMVHMDFDTDAAFAVHLKSFTDLMLISGAEKVVLLKSRKMYNSGFPRIGALIGNRPFSLIRFNY